MTHAGPRPELRRLDLGAPVLRLRLPVTPSQNAWRDLHWSERARRRDAALLIARAQVGRDLEAPWSRLALVVVVRCSEATVRADSANVWGGAKETVDVLLASRPKRPGVGLLVDDDPAHLVLGGVYDRPRGHYGDLDGPATWVYLVDLLSPSLTCPGEAVITSARVLAEAERSADEARRELIAAANAAEEAR